MSRYFERLFVLFRMTVIILRMFLFILRKNLDLLIILRKFIKMYRRKWASILQCLIHCET